MVLRFSRGRVGSRLFKCNPFRVALFFVLTCVCLSTTYLCISLRFGCVSAVPYLARLVLLLVHVFVALRSLSLWFFNSSYVPFIDTFRLRFLLFFIWRGSCLCLCMFLLHFGRWVWDFLTARMSHWLIFFGSVYCCSLSYADSGFACACSCCTSGVGSVIFHEPYMLFIDTLR